MTEKPPAPESKADVERKLAAAEAELQLTRGQLAEARSAVPTGSPARVTFPARAEFRGGTKLSEGERQDLEINGVATDVAGGGQLLASDFGIEVKTQAGRDRLAAAQQNRSEREQGAIEGVDFVYPSVAPGVLAPDAPVRGGVAVES